jgi:glucosamine-6-phosphate deaminase
VRVEVLPTDRWARAIADTWRERLSLHPGLRVCLASGTTPVPVYALMQDGFADAEVYLLDEFGGLPVGHPGRSASMVRTALVDHVDLPESQFHVPDVDAEDVGAACDRFDRLIDKGGLDLAVLGLGMNGHLGMNEPGTRRDAPTRVVELAPETREGTRRYGIHDPPTWGVTVGLAALLDAREVWLVVDGGRKQQILDRVLRGEVTTDCPASLLREHPHAIVWASDTAAG